MLQIIEKKILFYRFLKKNWNVLIFLFNNVNTYIFHKKMYNNLFVATCNLQSQIT